MNCLLCKVNNITTEKISDDFQMYKCGDCGFWFVIPRLTLENLLATYLSFTNCTEDFKLGRRPAISNSRWIADVIRRFFPQAKKVLELGCSSGYLLYGLQQVGYDVYGTDISSAAVGLAKKYYGINVWQTELPPHELAHTFDVIVVSHLIEHLVDPVDFINLTGKYLVKQGLLVLATPNLSSFGFKIFGVKYPIVSPPVHINFFNSSTAGRLLVESNFDILKLKSSSYDSFGRNSVFYNLLKSCLVCLFPKFQVRALESNNLPTDESENKKDIFKLRKLARQIIQIIMSPIFYLIDKFGYGDNLIIVARKK